MLLNPTYTSLMMALSVFVVLLWVSTTILMVPCFVSWRQFCCIGNVNDARYQRTVFVTLWITLAIPLNILLYSSNLYNEELLYWAYLLDAILIIFGIHLFRVLSFAFLDEMYKNHAASAGRQCGRPKWITLGTYLVVITVNSAVVVCYGVALFSSSEVEMAFIHIFYVLWCCIIIICGVIVYSVVRPISVILKKANIAINNIGTASNGKMNSNAMEHEAVNEEEIMSSILAMRIMHVMNVVTCITAAIHITIIALLYCNVLDKGVDGQLVQSAMHSQEMVMLAFNGVLLIVEKEGNCCFVRRYSLWRMWCMPTHYDMIRNSITAKESDAGSALLAPSSNAISDNHL